MSDPLATTHMRLSRRFDVPTHLVWDAFTEPDQLAEWFGPVGFSVPRESIDNDVRVGGYQRLTMVADNASMTSPMTSTYTEVVDGELLVSEETWEGIPDMQPGGIVNLRIEFHPTADDHTRLEISQGPFTELAEPMCRAGWTSSFTKLDTLLAKSGTR